MHKKIYKCVCVYSQKKREKKGENKLTGNPQDRFDSSWCPFIFTELISHFLPINSRVTC